MIHPPDIDAQRAWMVEAEVCDPKPYLDRNKDIVRETQMLVAAPAEVIEQLRSGTWSTVRYARRLGRWPLKVILPDGSTAT